MDNAVIEAPSHAISAQTAEHVLATGDLSKLSHKQKVELYIATCQSLRVNHLTRPFRFLKFNGMEQMYATKDLADQLRYRDKISLEIVDRAIDAGVYIVTSRATTPDGRRDEDIGAVPIERMVGEFRSNAVMKATTKAKRRVTLSICGLGFTDESELEGMRGVQTWDYDAEPPPPEATQPPTGHDKLAGQYEAVDPPKPSPDRPEAAWRDYVDKLQARLVPLTKQPAIEELAMRKSVTDALTHGPQWVKDEIMAMFAEARDRAEKYAKTEAAQDDLPPIAGEENLAAG